MFISQYGTFGIQPAPGVTVNPEAGGLMLVTDTVFETAVP